MNARTELRKLNGETQEDLAKRNILDISCFSAYRPHGNATKASPSHEVLIALCKRYGTSADYLLGSDEKLDIDPSDARPRKQRQRSTTSLTEEEQNEMHPQIIEEYLF